MAHQRFVVDRTTNGTGPVAGQTLATLQALDAGAWFGEAFAGARIPTPADVSTRYQGRAHLHIELKGHTAHLPQRTVDLVRTHGMAQHVTFTSFQRAHLQTMRAYAPELPTGWLVGEINDDDEATCRQLYWDAWQKLLNDATRDSNKLPNKTEHAAQMLLSTKTHKRYRDRYNSSSGNRNCSPALS